MPKRLTHVHGTKERPRDRQCYIFRFDGGRVLANNVRPADRAELLARLMGHYGNTVVTVYSRDMGRDEQYISLDNDSAVA